MYYLIQKEYANAAEGRALTLASALSNDIRLDTVRVAHIADLRGDASEALPVGSVEFVRAFAGRAGITLPEPIDYPSELSPWYHREIRRTTLADVHLGEFCKPVHTKDFTGKIVTSDFFHHHPSDMAVWACEAVSFGAEFRAYIQSGHILGIAQYDAGPDAAPGAVGTDEIMRMVGAWEGQPAAWALDVGVIGESAPFLAVVEVNDAWATGYYPHAMPAKKYAQWLECRWREILAHNAGQ